MIAKTREGADLVKVVDFGIAKASSSEAQNVTRAGLVVGTPEYMSPEQLAADKLDGRSDTYSLGLVAFNCLTGVLPFPAETSQEVMIMRLTEAPRTLTQMRAGIEWPDAVQATLDKALARDAAERYQSAAQFGREFAAAISEMPETKAAEGATMVIGAQGLAAAAGAAAKPVPATRVAGRAPGSSTPTPGAAAAVVVKKNRVPLYAGGALLLVAAAVGSYVMMNGSGAETNAGVPPNVASALDTADPAASSQIPGATTTPPGGTERPSAPVNPEPVPPRTTPVTTPTTSNPGVTTPATPSVMTRLEGWVNDLQDSTVTRSTARRILGDVETLRPTLSGVQLAESWYVTALANVALEDQEGSCSAAREVKRLNREASRIAFADRIIQFCQ